MKVRTDFVTNSSSSSFVIAQKGELTEKQKKAIIELIEKEFFGDGTIKTLIELKEYARDHYMAEDEEQFIKMREALESGKTIYTGDVSFEDMYWNYAELFTDIWKTLRDSSDGEFEIIDGDLEY